MLVSTVISWKLNMTSRTTKTSKNKPSRGDKDSRTSNYRQLEFRDHCLMRPHNYGMNTARVEGFEWMWNGERLELEATNLPLGVIRAFIEVISNAADENTKAINRGENPGPIAVDVTSKRVTITNDHTNIPIDKMKTREGEVYVPEAIFGQVMTSGNYDDDEAKQGSGQNGYGSKVVNCMSVEFSCEVIDHINSLNYYQVWTDNLQVHPPEITRIKPVNYGEVTISYVLDFKRFGLRCYSDLELDIFYRHCIDMSFCSQTPVTFNGEEIMIKSAADYVNLYFGSNGNRNSKIQFIDDLFEADNYKLRVLIVDRDSADDKGHTISFVNCLNVPNHGVHVDVVYKAIAEPIRDIFNADLPEGAKKLTVRDIKKYLNVIVIANVENPVFEGPAKQQLQSPVIKLQLTEAHIKRYQKIVKWKCMSQLKDKSDELRRKKALGQLKGKRGKRIDFGSAKKNIIRANWAGTKRSRETVLIIVEGESAACYCGPFIALQPGGRNKYGVLQLQGKILNVAKYYANNPERIAESPIIQLIIKALGLDFNTDYSLKKNRDKLNYGQIMIMTDADDDGLHIKGLIDNFFYTMFPDLLSPEFMSYYRVPVIKGYKGDKVVKFYTNYEFQAWKDEHLAGKTTKVVNDKRTIGGWEFRYFKGLATSTSNDVEEDASNPMIIRYRMDPEAADWIEKMFLKSSIEDRKKWVISYQEDSNHPFTLTEDDILSNFFKNEFIFYILTSLTRSIVHQLDGLKESQRKILWTSFKLKSKHKVFQFGGSVAKKTEYEHGDMSLHKAIIVMARNYSGSNNMEYLTPIGQFGNREDPKAGSPRYISIDRAWWLDLVFHQDDMRILTFSNPEPDFLLPIIPMQLINGTEGVATGWSSTIPAYNPLDIIEWLIARLKSNLSGEDPDWIQLKPWYRYHTGQIELKSDNDSASHVVVHHSRHYLYEVDEETGEVIEMDCLDEGNGIVVITELPIPIIPIKYKNKVLETKLHAGLIEDYTHHMAVDEAFFVVHNPKKVSELNLIVEQSLSNMYQLDGQGRPQHSINVYHLLEEFFTLRLPFYQKRKDSVIARMEDKLTELRYKLKFIKLVIEGKIVVVKQPKVVIHSKMEEYDIPRRIYSLRLQYDNDEVAEIQDQIHKLETELEAYMKLTIEELWMQDLTVLREALQKNHILEHLTFYYKRLSRYFNKLAEATNNKKADIDELILREVFPREIELTQGLIRNLHLLEGQWKTEWTELAKFHKTRKDLISNLIKDETKKSKNNSGIIRLLRSDPIMRS